jgi:polysaccharide chain length determinant protein (PEP-CTERM system associated)
MISDLRFYLKLLPRRLPVMLLLFMISAIGGVILAQRLPSVYETSSTLLVESAQISDDLVRTTVQVTAAEQLQVIEKQLLTRSNLIDIANDVRIFEEQNQMTPDEIVEAMRKSTSINLTTGRDQATLMVIGFKGTDPVKVAEVVNRYVSIALESSVEDRKDQSDSTLSFFQQEVQRLSEELDLQSGKIVTFKDKNGDALPENLEYRQNRQSLLQERVSRGERELESLESQRANILRVYEATGSVDSDPNARLSAEELRLQNLEGELSVARSTLSETNPRVRNLKAQVDALTAQIEASGVSESETQAPLSAQETALDISLAEIDSRTSALQQEIQEANKELAELRVSIERTPANGIILAGMEREQENIQSLYNGSVSRLAAARMSSRVEAASKGERITVLEAASVPDEPASPNRKQIAALGVLLGLGLAGGLFFLLELLNQVIRRPVDIVKALDITPLATLPNIETAAHRRWRRAAQFASLLAVIAMVPTMLWAIDTYYMPLDLLFEKIKDRLS